MCIFQIYLKDAKDALLIAFPKALRATVVDALETSG